VPIRSLIDRVVSLEHRKAVVVAGGPNISLPADPDQLEQLLINLLRNAVEATLETNAGVTVGWEVKDGNVRIRIDDEGPGVSNTANLFVPFFTTKPGGSGIGLVLSRQIAEAHGGTLSLENRHPAPGCRATLVLPLMQ
jgi:signal transduction histidine kinase